jgi:Gas vesicle protein
MPAATPQAGSLADVLDRVLDKGVVIAGDIRINLLDVELLTIKLRLLIASVDKAREMGIDWWERDESLSTGAALDQRRRLEEQVQGINDRLDRLERMLAPRPAGGGGGGDADGDGPEPAGRSKDDG